MNSLEKPQKLKGNIKKNTGALSHFTQIFNCVGIPLLFIDKDLKRILHINPKAQSIIGDIKLVSDWESRIQIKGKLRLSTVLEKAMATDREKSMTIITGKSEWLAKIYPADTGVVVSFERVKSKTPGKTELYKAVFDSMEDQFLLTDSQFNIVDVNEAFLKRSGYTRAEILKLKSLQLTDSLKTKDVKEFRKSAREKPIYFDVRRKNADGAATDFEVNFFPVELKDRSYFGALSRDVTEFKKIQDQLINTNHRFEMITNSTMEGLWLLDLVTGERWGNKLYRNFYGRTCKDPVPLNEEWRERIHPSMRTEVATGFQHAINNKETNWSAEYWFKPHKGDYIFIFDRALMTYGEDGQLLKMMGSMIDVTELKKAQDQFHSQKNLSEGIINSLPGVFLLLNKQRRILRWNKNFEKLTGYNSRELKKMHPSKLFHPDEVEDVKQKILESFEKGRAEMEVNLMDKQGNANLYYLTGWKAIIGNEECMIGIGIDMSEIKKAQDRIKQMEEKITNQKIQEQKTISRAIINAQEKERNHIGRELHDNVNQLLAGARLYLTMGAKNNPGLCEVLKYPLELLDNGIKEIRSLTHHTITPSKDLELRHLINGIAELLAAGSIQCTVNFNLSRQLNENLLVNVYRILQEQANNIIKHSNASNVSISIGEKDNQLWIQTKDDGIGFDVHQLREGIGLYNIYSRVDAYNGEVEIESAPGKGCRIDIKIPAFETPRQNIKPVNGEILASPDLN